MALMFGLSDRFTACLRASFSQKMPFQSGGPRDLRLGMAADKSDDRDVWLFQMRSTMLKVL